MACVCVWGGGDLHREVKKVKMAAITRVPRGKCCKQTRLFLRLPSLQLNRWDPDRVYSVWSYRPSIKRGGTGWPLECLPSFYSCKNTPIRISEAHPCQPCKFLRLFVLFLLQVCLLRPFQRPNFISDKTLEDFKGILQTRTSSLEAKNFSLCSRPGFSPHFLRER